MGRRKKHSDSYGQINTPEPPTAPYPNFNAWNVQTQSFYSPAPPPQSIQPVPYNYGVQRQEIPEPTSEKGVPSHSRGRGRPPGRAQFTQPPAPPSDQQDTLGRYKCSYCPQTFTTGPSARRHEISHSDNSKPFECDICGTRFTQSYTVVVHKQRFHGPGAKFHVKDRVHQCPNCPAQFKQIKQLQSHVGKTHRGERMREHRKSVIRGFSCKLCPVTFQRITRLREHMKYHAKWFQAHKSGQAPPRYKITKNIQDIYNKMRGAKTCGKYLRAFDPLIELPKCKDCGLDCPSKLALMSHRGRMHPGRHPSSLVPGEVCKSYQCDYCARKCSDKSQLENHIRAKHMKLDIHESKYCSRKFRYLSSVVQHERRHERLGICIPSKKRYETQATRDKIRARTCELCGEQFGNSYFHIKHFLEKHRRHCNVKVLRLEAKAVDHSEDGPTALCTTCGNRFKASEFKLHLVTSPVTCGVDCMAQLSFDFGESYEPELDTFTFEAATVFGDAENLDLFDENRDEPLGSPDRPLAQELESEPEGSYDSGPEPMDFTDSPESEPIPVIIKVEFSKEDQGKLCPAPALPAPPMVPKSELTRHIRQHNLCKLSVSMNRMLFKYVEQLRTMSILKSSQDSLNIPWYVCGKCGRAFAFKVEWHEHQISCPRKYDFVHRHQIHHRSELDKLPTIAEPPYPGGYYDRWDTNLFPETVPHPSTFSGIVMARGGAYCRTCLKFFKSSRGVEGHLDAHREMEAVNTEIGTTNQWKDSEGGKIQCTTCDKIFGPDAHQLRYAKRHHYVNHHAAGAKMKPKFVCEHCAAQLKTKTTYEAHLRIHTGERPFLCDVCPKKFASSAHLCTHKRDAHNKKNYECKTCGKVSTFYVGHMVHLRTHRPGADAEQSKNLLCSDCGQQCDNVRQLQKHRMDVHGETRDEAMASGRRQRFACSKCTKIYGTHNCLRRHEILEHPANGIKPKLFECKLCDQGFMLIKSMRDHLRSRHANQLWPPELLHQNTVTLPGGEGGSSTTYSLESYLIRKKWSSLEKLNENE